MFSDTIEYHQVSPRAPLSLRTFLVLQSLYTTFDNGEISLHNAATLAAYAAYRQTPSDSLSTTPWQYI